MRTHVTKIAAAVSGIIIATTAPAMAGNSDTPANDDHVDAETIVELPFGDTVDTAGATLEADEPQPTCSSISSSVWYRFTSTQTIKAVAEGSASERTAIAVFRGRSFDDIFEVACSSGVSLETRFDAVANQTYLIQVGSTGKKRGTVDIGIVSTTWKETELGSFEQEIDVPYTKVNLLTIDGRPRSGNASMYDLTIATKGQRLNRGFLTFGLVQERIHQELVTIDRSAASVETVVSYRYDSAQRECITDGGHGSSCSAHSPVKDLGWILQNGADAELVVTVKVSNNKGIVTAERTLVVPFAGQALGII